MNWDELCDRIDRDPEVIRNGGASEERVRAAEELVGAFPGDYRRYLLRYGQLSRASEQVYGLDDSRELPKPLDVEHMSLVERRDAPGLPSNAIVICNNGSGDLSYLVAGADDASQVFVWIHDAVESPLVEADSFIDWLAQRFEYQTS